MDTHQTLAPSATDNFLSAGEKAESLIAQQLKEGPRNASAVLAIAEGANVSLRTMQRAAIALGVVKAKAGFQGGWTWRLPADDADAPAAQAPSAPKDGKVAARVERAEVIAARLRKLEAGRGKKAPIYAADPRLLRWVEEGISDPQLREAYELAVYSLESEKSQAALTAGFLDKYIAEVIGQGDKA